MPAFTKSTSRQSSAFGKRGESRAMGFGTKASKTDISKRGFAGSTPHSLVKMDGSVVDPMPIQTS